MVVLVTLCLFILIGMYVIDQTFLLKVYYDDGTIRIFKVMLMWFPLVKGMHRQRYLLRIGHPEYWPDWWLMCQLKRYETIFPHGFHLLAEAQIGENDYMFLQTQRAHISFEIGH